MVGPAGEVEMLHAQLDNLHNELIEERVKIRRLERVVSELLADRDQDRGAYYGYPRVDPANPFPPLSFRHHGTRATAADTPRPFVNQTARVHIRGWSGMIRRVPGPGRSMH